MNIFSRSHVYSHKVMVTVLYILTLFYSLHYALIIYLHTLYLEQAFGKNSSDFAYPIASLLTIIVAFRLSNVLNKYKNYRVLVTALLIEILIVALMGIVTTGIVSVILFIIHQVASASIYISLSLALEEVSKRGEVGAIRGVFMTILALGVLSSTFISGLLYKAFSFSGVYVTSAMILLPTVFLVWKYISSIQEPVYKHISFLASYKKIIADKNITRITIAQCTLGAFYAVMIVYGIPYVHTEMGIATSTILGVIMPIALIPFVIFPYELGILADTKIGEKEILITGLSIMAFFTVLVAMTDTQSVAVWALLFLGGRIGASFVESAASIYFFKKVKKEDAGMMTFFNTTSTFAYILVPLCVFVLQTIVGLSMASIFILLAIGIMLVIRVSSRLEDTL